MEEVFGTKERWRWCWSGGFSLGFEEAEDRTLLIWKMGDAGYRSNGAWSSRRRTESYTSEGLLHGERRGPLDDVDVEDDGDEDVEDDIEHRNVPTWENHVWDGDKDHVQRHDHLTSAVPSTSASFLFCRDIVQAFQSQRHHPVALQSSLHHSQNS